MMQPRVMGNDFVKYHPSQSNAHHGVHCILKTASVLDS